MFGEELLADTFYVPLFLGIVCLLCIYRYSTQNFDYWKKKGIPQAGPAIPIIGTMYPMLWKPAHELDWERYQKLGPVFGQYDGRTPVLAVGDPKLVREILVKDFPSFKNRRISEFLSEDAFVRCFLVSLKGEEWKRVRNAVSPYFTTGKFKKLINCMKPCGRTMIDNLKEATESEKPLEVKQFSGFFALDVIASIIYSIQLDSYKDPNNDFSQKTFQCFSQNSSYKMALFHMWPRLAKWIGVEIFNTKPMYFFKELAIHVMKQRKKTGETRSDFLEFVMGLVKEFPEEEEGSVGNNGMGMKSREGQIKTDDQIKKRLTLEEAIAQILQFSLGGFDTVSSTLSKVAYLLALHPDIQNRTFEEMRDILQKTEGDLTYEAIQEMNLLDNVLHETLRLYPHFTRLERLADEDYKSKDTGVTIPKGTTIIVLIYAMHRDPKLYPDPERFDPDRFLPKERAKRDPYAYMAFGTGPRFCIGMRYSQLLVKTCLIYLLANFKFHICPETKVPLEFLLGPGAMRFKKHILRFEERTDKILIK